MKQPSPSFVADAGTSNAHDDCALHPGCSYQTLVRYDTQAHCAGSQVSYCMVSSSSHAGYAGFAASPLHSNMRFYKGGARKRDVLFTNAYGFHFYADVFRCLRLCLVGSHMFTAQKCTQGALFNIGDDGIHPSELQRQGRKNGRNGCKTVKQKKSAGPMRGNNSVHDPLHGPRCPSREHRSPQKCQLSQDPSLPPHPVEGFSPAGLRLSGSTFYDSGLEITRTCPFRLSHSSYV